MNNDLFKAKPNVLQRQDKYKQKLTGNETQEM